MILFLFNEIEIMFSLLNNLILIKIAIIQLYLIEYVCVPTDLT